MRRSSSRSEPPRLLDGALARGPVRDAVSDAAWLSALLTVEAALTWVQAEVGLVPQAAAEAIAAAGRPERFDVAALGRIAAQGGNPVIPLVETLRGAVGPTHARHVHQGATSQDVLDTGGMLVALRALEHLLTDLAGAANATAHLAVAHRDTLIAGRTVLHRTVPVTFGLLAAGWMARIDAAGRRLADVRRHRLAVPPGVAAGPAPRPRPAL